MIWIVDIRIYFQEIVVGTIVSHGVDLCHILLINVMKSTINRLSISNIFLSMSSFFHPAFLLSRSEIVSK